jgi:hypothetical protein
MRRTYEPLASPRYTVASAGGMPEITIRAQTSGFMLAFLGVWLSIWTAGGIYAASTLLSEPAQSGGPWSILPWLGLWLLGEVLVAAALAWFATGAQIVRIRGSDLERADRVLGFEHRKAYPGSDIRNLHAREPDGYTGPRRPLATPINRDKRNSSIAFEHAGRTVYLAMGLDRRDGQQIVAQLARHLPASAIAKG